MAFFLRSVFRFPELKSPSMASKKAQSLLQPSFLSTLAVIVWLGGIHLDILLFLLAIVNFPSVFSFTLLAIQLACIFSPIKETGLGEWCASFVSKHAPSFFPIRAHVEDVSAFDPKQTYVIGAEPHSVLPIGLLALQSELLPLTKMKCLASSAIFWAPLVRHVWSWLGLAPATKENFRKLLRSGHTVVLIPGGVQECLYMEHGQEVIFLKQRHGFIKLAMEVGAPLVPAFCFGQSNTYRFWRPKGKWYAGLSRRIGFTPIAFWGLFGSPLPYPAPMFLVIGKPIPVEKNVAPTNEEVALVHGKFLRAMEELFERHKADAGYEELKLRVC